MTPVRLRLLWHPQPQFAGYLVAQHDGPAAERDLALECVPVDFSLGPIDAVLTGDCDFAVASPAHLIESRAPHDLVMLLAIQQTSSLMYGVRRDAGIARAADLVARKIAVWPGGEDLELRWMLHRAGVPAGAATLVPALDTVAALLDDKVACAQMTTYHEVFELEHRAHSLEPYRFLAAAENDAALLKDGLFARRDWIAAHRATAQRVVDAVLDGWTRAFDAPEAAIDRCVALRPDLSRAHQTAQLDAIRALAMTGATHTHGLGYPDARHVDAALRAVREVEGRTIAGQGADFVDASFWEAAPAALRQTSV
jgi:NitT/TauT family transport system substrate-binding protein